MMRSEVLTRAGLGQFVNRACPLPNVRRTDILGTSARSSPIPLLKTGSKQRAPDRSLATVRVLKMRRRMPGSERAPVAKPGDQ